MNCKLNRNVNIIIFGILLVAFIAFGAFGVMENHTAMTEAKLSYKESKPLFLWWGMIALSVFMLFFSLKRKKRYSRIVILLSGIVCLLTVCNTLIYRLFSIATESIGGLYGISYSFSAYGYIAIALSITVFCYSFIGFYKN